MKILFLDDNASYHIRWTIGQSYFQRINVHGDEFNGFTEYSSEGEGQPPDCNEAASIAQYDFDNEQDDLFN